MESNVGQENIKSRLRIQPSRRAKKKDINNDDKENLPNQGETTYSKVATKKTKKVGKTEPVLDRTLKTADSKSDKIKKKKINKGAKNIVSHATPANANEGNKGTIDFQEICLQVSEDFQQPKSFILKPGEKRKRNQDKTTFAPIQTRSFSIALNRNEIEKYKSSSNVYRSIELSIHSQNSLAEDENISLDLKSQPTMKVRQAPCKKNVKDTVKKGRARNKIVPFKKTKQAAEYVVGELVLAHVTGFCDWPAFIRAIDGQIISVEFFGTGHMNPLRSDRIKVFDLDIARRLLARKGFSKAIAEIEIRLGISSDESILN